jgi:hypothetical protein
MPPTFPLLVAALLAGGAPAGKAPATVWRDTVLLKEKDLTVRLKVLARASLADIEWMALEFENKGQRPLTVTNASYWMRAEYRHLGTGQGAGSGSLASGNTFDLFPHAWATTPVSPIVLPPGKTYRAAEQPSDYSAALLGLPPPGGLSVRGRVYLAVDLRDGRHLRPTEAAGVPFAFDWTHPTDGGFKALRARLARLLRSPQNRAYHAYILGAYLRIPQVARAATADELVTALARRRGPFEGRAEVAAYVAKHFSNDPAVAAYYRQRLKDGDLVVLADLRLAALWDRNHVKPLVGLYESDPMKHHEALAVLHRYRDDWVEDGATVRLLSTVVRRAYPALGRDVRRLEKEGLEHWADAVMRLSMTGDRSALVLLLPALADKRAFRSTKRLSLPVGAGVPPVRVCDVALEATLTLLDGSPDEAYRRAGPAPVGAGDLDAAYAALRDGMIAALKKRLGPGGKGR